MQVVHGCIALLGLDELDGGLGPVLLLWLRAFRANTATFKRQARVGRDVRGTVACVEQEVVGRSPIGPLRQSREKMDVRDEDVDGEEMAKIGGRFKPSTAIRHYLNAVRDLPASSHSPFGSTASDLS